jgi:plasmid stability protein
MTVQPITVHLPTGLYNRLKRRAERAHRSVEAEMLATVAETLPADEDLSPELAQAVSRLAALDDDALWQAAQARFPAEKSTKLEVLHLRRQAGSLSQAEAHQAAALTDELEQFMFLRAQALSLLMQRGHDVAGLAAP